MNLPAMQKSQEMWAQSLGQGDPLEKAMATHSGILACRIPEKAMATHSGILVCRIPWTEEVCGL